MVKNMRERIILAPGAKESEIYKNLALHGINCINLKIINSVALARLALLKSAIPLDKEFVDSNEEYVLMAEAVAGEKYFGNATYSDIKQIAHAIRSMRYLVTDDDEVAVISNLMRKGIFTDKNTALVSVLKKYLESICSKNAIDGILLIRKAIKEAKVIDADFECLSELPLNPLEEMLLSKVSGNNFKHKSALDLYNVKYDKIKIASFKNCYGASNEIETILDDIYKNKKLDKCTVALAESDTYAQLFFDYSLLHDIPVTFGCGIPIINSNPAKLLELYFHWSTDGYYDAFALNNMLSSSVFNKSKLLKSLPDESENFNWKKFYEKLGNLRLTNNSDINNQRIEAYVKAADDKEKELFAPCLKAIAKELALPVEDFISKYSRIRTSSQNNAEKMLMMLDISAAVAIFEELKIVKYSETTQTTEDIMLNVLKLNVARENSREGALHITDIRGALSTPRQNIYIAGMSASKYPGSPKEDYLLLDEDLKLFGEKAESLASYGKITRKKDTMFALLRLGSALDCNIYVSYSGMNVSELKKENASAMIFEIVSKEIGRSITYKEFEKLISKVDYFEPAISITKNIGKAYNDGKDIIASQSKLIKPEIADFCNPILDKEYSPSSLNTFFGCPRQFMLRYVLGIQEPDEFRPFEIISSAERGSLAHTMMEKLANTQMTRDEFLKLSGDAFDKFIAQNTPLIFNGVGAEKNQFFEMMETAYNMDPRREVVLKEEDVHSFHESGIKLHGLPDRVEKLEDGKYLIVDFKTGRNIEHLEDDIDTCLQIVVYAYLMEQQGMEITGGEFRYTKLGKTISCKYDSVMKAKLNDKLTVFKQHIESGEYPCASEFNGSNDACNYCKYCEICGKH